MSENERARHWRTARKLTQQQLSDLTGYSRTSVICFEQGRDFRGRELDEFAWQRFKRCCHSVAMELDGGLETGKGFNWEVTS